MNNLEQDLIREIEDLNTLDPEFNVNGNPSKVRRNTLGKE